jgi:hypothetical protein
MKEVSGPSSRRSRPMPVTSSTPVTTTTGQAPTSTPYTSRSAAPPIDSQPFLTWERTPNATKTTAAPA